MDLDLYQIEALKTAKPAALDLKGYVAPGLFSEAGELIQVFAKAHRDEALPYNYMPKAVLEYGDCYWMTAVGLHLHDVDRIAPGSMYSQTLESALEHIAEQACKVYLDPEDPSAWVEMWCVLDEGCRAVTGEDRGYVKRANLGKLEGRYKDAR